MAANAPTIPEVMAKAMSIHDSYEFAGTILAICAKDLGMDRETVMNTPPSDTALQYSKFETETAQTSGWIGGSVAMIACTQVS